MHIVQGSFTFVWMPRANFCFLDLLLWSPCCKLLEILRGEIASAELEMPSGALTLDCLSASKSKEANPIQSREVVQVAHPQVTVYDPLPDLAQSSARLHTQWECTPEQAEFVLAQPVRRSLSALPGCNLVEQVETVRRITSFLPSPFSNNRSMTRKWYSLVASLHQIDHSSNLRLIHYALSMYDV